MAKIAIFDQVNKFMGDLRTHWEAMGHEVKRENTFNPALVHWADTTFFEFCEGSVQVGSNPESEFWKENPQPKDKNIICRIHDIDIWSGGPSIVHWDWVNHAVFVCDYMRKICNLEEGHPNPQIHTINHGINLDKFTFNERRPGYKIAWAGNICQHKCLELALQVLAENPSYELHVAGNGFRPWEENYVKEFVSRNNLKYFYYGRVPDMNEWLEDKNFILLTSFKEAFSFIVGESMAKGIKPLIHNFAGAEDIWDKKYIWNKVSEVKPMLNAWEYNSGEYRQFVEARYPLQKMLEEYDKIMFK